MHAPVPRRRVPDDGRQQGHRRGVAHVQPGPAVRVPGVQQRHPVARPHPRPEVLTSRPRHRFHHRVPHRLQPLAPRVPAALLKLVPPVHLGDERGRGGTAEHDAEIARM